MTSTSTALPFVFIVGYGRSGTTLLAALLDSHPSIAIPGETSGVIRVLCRQFTPGEGQSTAFDTERFVDALLDHRRFRLWGLDEVQLRKAVAAQAPSQPAEAIRAVYSFFAAAQGKPMFGDQTPKHVLTMKELTGFFPEARFIHLIRDGRNAAIATVQASWGPTTVPEAAAEWKAWVETGRAHGGDLGPDKYLEVRYEELTGDPNGTLQSITAFLGVEFTEAMLDKDAAVERQLAMSTEPDAGRSLSRPITPNLRDWKRQMDAWDVAAINSIAGDTLCSLGYET